MAEAISEKLGFISLLRLLSVQLKSFTALAIGMRSTGAPKSQFRGRLIVVALVAWGAGSVIQAPKAIAQTSTDGSRITPGSGGSITDSSGNVWTFSSQGNAYGNFVLQNGGQPSNLGVATLLTIKSGTIYVQNSYGWYQYGGGGWVFQSVGPSFAAVTTSTSPDGSRITPGSGGSITDGSGNVWTFSAQGNAYGNFVLLNGGQPSNPGVATLLTIKSGTIYVQNSFGWYQYAGGVWVPQSGGPSFVAAPSSPGGPPTSPGGPPTPDPQPASQSTCYDFSVPLPAPLTSPGALGDEFVGPFANWANLKRDFGAIGDGVADDTQAIQMALTSLSVAGKSPVLYIPPGTYRVTQTVSVMAAQFITVIGADPSTTILKWAGASGGILFHIDGVAYSRFNRLTFDGSGIAGVLVDQSVENYSQGRQFDTGNEYADDVFENAGIGIQGGQYDLGAAESTVLRSTFVNNSLAGIILKNFNALDWWVSYSHFKNNQKGITNNPGAGNFHAFNNLFETNLIDLDILNTGNFNFRDNFSLNSKIFLYEEFYWTNAAVTRLQGNTIIIPSTTFACGKGGCGMYQGNMGPTIMTDNTWVSPADAQTPPVVIQTFLPPDCVSIGNRYTYTASTPVQCASSQGPGRLLTVDDQVVSSSSIDQTPPTLPGVLPNISRMVFDVPAGSNSAMIQQAIQQAMAYCGSKPVVHMGYGNYAIGQTITVPANCDIQLVGDGGSTHLAWVGGGSGPVLLLQGPSRAILRDFYVSAGNVSGIEVKNVDQQGSRIFMQKGSVARSSTANLFVDSLDYTNVELRNFNLQYTAVSPASTGVALKVVGGPLAAQGKPQYGRTNLFAGGGGVNYVSVQASKGASVLVRDAWYEGANQSTYAQISDNSSVTLEGSRMALPATGDAVQLNNLSCRATIMSSALDSDVKINGGQNPDVWVVGNNFGAATTYLQNLGSSGGVSFNLNRNQMNGSSSIPDISALPDANFIRKMFAQSRAAHPTTILDLPAGITDVRFYNVIVELGNIGIHLER